MNCSAIESRSKLAENPGIANCAEAHYNLGFSYLTAGDKGSALEEYKILKALDAEVANKLFNLIYK